MSDFNKFLKFKPGTMLQLRGTHMIKKSVPDWFNYYYDNNDCACILEENDTLIVLGLAKAPWNQSKEDLSREDYPVVEIFVNGEYGVIKQHKLMCGLYKEVSK